MQVIGIILIVVLFTCAWCVSYLALFRRISKIPPLKPTVSSDSILFQERFASGHSLKNIFLRLGIGGAHNCLHLIVTWDHLWVTSWFPFSIIAQIYDLEHVIPIQNIQSVRRTCFILEGVRIIYADAQGELHAIQLYPHYLKDFLEALNLVQAGQS